MNFELLTLQFSFIWVVVWAYIWSTRTTHATNTWFLIFIALLAIRIIVSDWLRIVSGGSWLQNAKDYPPLGQETDHLPGLSWARESPKRFGPNRSWGLVLCHSMVLMWLTDIQMYFESRLKSPWDNSRVPCHNISPSVLSDRLEQVYIVLKYHPCGLFRVLMWPVFD